MEVEVECKLAFYVIRYFLEFTYIFFSDVTVIFPPPTMAIDFEKIHPDLN